MRSPHRLKAPVSFPRVFLARRVPTGRFGYNCRVDRNDSATWRHESDRRRRNRPSCFHEMPEHSAVEGFLKSQRMPVGGRQETALGWRRSRRAVLALRCSPLSRAQPPFDDGLAPLHQILASKRGLPDEHDPVPFGPLPPLSRVVRQSSSVGTVKLTMGKPVGV
jgi:hypothetical protein